MRLYINLHKDGIIQKILFYPCTVQTSHFYQLKQFFRQNNYVYFSQLLIFLLQYMIFKFFYTIYKDFVNGGQQDQSFLPKANNKILIKAYLFKSSKAVFFFKFYKYCSKGQVLTLSHLTHSHPLFTTANECTFSNLPKPYFFYIFQILFQRIGAHTLTPHTLTPSVYHHK